MGAVNIDYLVQSSIDPAWFEYQRASSKDIRKKSSVCNQVSNSSCGVSSLGAKVLNVNTLKVNISILWIEIETAQMKSTTVSF